MIQGTVGPGSCSGLVLHSTIGLQYHRTGNFAVEHFRGYMSRYFYCGELHTF